MTSDVPAETRPDQARTVEEKIALLRKLFADAPEVGRTALDNVLSRLESQASQKPPPPVESAGRVGSRLGKVSELTIIVPFAPGGAQRLRAFLRLFGGNLAGADAAADADRPGGGPVPGHDRRLARSPKRHDPHRSPRRRPSARTGHR